MNTLNISDKERLELLEESFNHDIKNHNAYSIADYDISWLIEQAKENQEMKEQNKRYCEALKFYASEITWQVDITGVSDADKFKGELAIKALEVKNVDS